MTAIKVCGVTCVEDAELAIGCGVDAIGVNLIPSSRRLVELSTARAIAQAAYGRAEVVGLVADLSVSELLELRDAAQLDLLQLHGDEPPERLAAVLPAAYKAVRIGGAEDVALAARYGGERILVDAKVEGHLGGTGVSFDWALVKQLAQERCLVLAGGLNPDNVERALREVKPWGVDVASGVQLEGQPRRKDLDELRRFVEAVRSADSSRP